jgi:hypothetical protein
VGATNGHANKYVPPVYNVENGSFGNNNFMQPMRRLREC